MPVLVSDWPQGKWEGIWEFWWREIDMGGGIGAKIQTSMPNTQLGKFL